MDHAAFDRIARLLGGAATRRAGLHAVLGALGGSAAAAASLAAGEAPSERGADVAGPCGRRSKDNRCTTHEQCCTGYCKPGKRGKTGRCRCAPRKARCTSTTKCCHGLACSNGRCQRKPSMPALVPNGQPCTAASTCADAAATCRGYGSGNPAGTYCLLPGGSACAGSGDCVFQDCNGGVCGSCSWPGCDGPCTPTVCPTCPNQTLAAAVQAATDGEVIVLAAGTYVESVTIPSSVTLRACGRDSVILTNTTGNRTITMSPGKTLELVNIVLDGDSASTSAGGGIKSDSAVTTWGKTIIRGGYDANGPAIEVTGKSTPNPVITLNDDTTIEDNGADTYGAITAFQADLVMNDSSRITGNTAGKTGGGIYAGVSTVTLNDRAIVSGNTATQNRGGGIYLYQATFNASGSVTVSGNTAGRQGGGIYCDQSTMNGSPTYASNTPNNCEGGCCP